MRKVHESEETVGKTLTGGEKVVLKWEHPKNRRLTHMKRIKAACLEQTVQFLLKEDLPHEEAVKYAEAEYAHYLAQMDKTGRRTASWKNPCSRMAPFW